VTGVQTCALPIWSDYQGCNVHKGSHRLFINTPA